MTSTPSSQAGRPTPQETVDTRRPEGPEGRLYVSSFAEVWDRALDSVRERNRWEIVHHDEDLGLVTVRCRGFLPRSASVLTIWVSLDDNGLTRLDARCVAEGRRAAGGGERLVRDLLDGIDRALGPGARVRS